MTLYRTITNHDILLKKLFVREFCALDGQARVAISAPTAPDGDTVNVTWRWDDGRVEEHAIAATQLTELEVQRHVKDPEGKSFDTSERKSLKVAFGQLTPCDLVELDRLRQY